MKFIIFAGTPGSGKTSIIKHIIKELKDDFKLFFAKFDCLQTSDDELISHDYEIVNLPDAVRRKFPNAKKEFKWQYVFRQ